MRNNLAAECNLFPLYFYSFSVTNQESRHSFRGCATMKNQTLHFIRGSALWLLNAHSLFLFIIIFIYLFFALFTQSALQIKLTQSPARDTQLITRKGKRLLSPGCVTPERESDGVCFTPTVSPSLCLLLPPLFHHYFLPEDKDFALQASYQSTPSLKKKTHKKWGSCLYSCNPFRTFATPQASSGICLLQSPPPTNPSDVLETNCFVLTLSSAKEHECWQLWSF